MNEHAQASAVELEITQHDYDDGLQSLSLKLGDEKWEEVRRYEGDCIEAYYILRDAHIRGHLIYDVIRKISRCVETTRKIPPSGRAQKVDMSTPPVYA